MATPTAGAPAAAPGESIETRASWVIAFAVLLITAIAFGAPLVAVAGLRQLAEELGGQRSVPGLAFSLAWFGAAVGGVIMGRVAERFGIRRTVALRLLHRRGPPRLLRRAVLAALGRARDLHRAARQRLHQRAGL